MVSFTRPILSDGWPVALEIGCAGLALAGETRSGDLAVFAPHERGGLVAAIDGLGHGDAAADASEAAAAVLTARAGLPLGELFTLCHDALRDTRGVVMTLADFDLGARRMEWAGVGNVEARLLRRAEGAHARHAGPTVLGGVVGYNLPAQIRTTVVELEAGDAVAFATDGVTADFSAVLNPALEAQVQAERVLGSHGKGTDDALAVVVRWVG
jgi:negative regulator of sigma-B (phosphoserine phosphatase)